MDLYLYFHLGLRYPPHDAAWNIRAYFPREYIRNTS